MEDNDRQLAWLFHGWVEHVTLFAMLLVAVVLVCWAWNRGFRPADRGPLAPWPLLLGGYGLLLLLRHFREGLWPAIIVGVAVLIAGIVARQGRPGGLWIVVCFIAALLGIGLNLSAILLTFAATLVLLLSARQGR